MLTYGAVAAALASWAAMLTEGATAAALACASYEAVLADPRPLAFSAHLLSTVVRALLVDLGHPQGSGAFCLSA